MINIKFVLPILKKVVHCMLIPLPYPKGYGFRKGVTYRLRIRTCWYIIWYTHIIIIVTYLWYIYASYRWKFCESIFFYNNHVFAFRRHTCTYANIAWVYVELYSIRYVCVCRHIPTYMYVDTYITYTYLCIYVISLKKKVRSKIYLNVFFCAFFDNTFVFRVRVSNMRFNSNMFLNTYT